MNATKLRWYWHRLGRMSLGEMIYRAKNMAYAKTQQWGLFTVDSVPTPDLDHPTPPWPPEGLGEMDPQPYIAASERILDGKLDVFRLEGYQLGNPPQWNRDPLTGTQPPLTFGPTLNYRDEKLVGDIKYLWEPSRHLHLVTLAQAWKLTQEERYLEGIANHLESWLDQAPYLHGPHWSSSLELGIRLINWSLVWRLTDGASQPPFLNKKLRQRWLQSIYQHAHFIRWHFSGFSSANNHLIGEAAGLYAAAVTWPIWPKMASWKKVAKNILIEEALHQNAPDGVNREQAISYQQFVLDFLLIPGLMGEELKEPFPKEYWRRIEHMLEFVEAIMDVGGNLPMIGDADDGYAVRLSQEIDFDCYRSLMATGSVIFSRKDLQEGAGRLDHKTQWLLGKKGEQAFARLKNSETIDRKDATSFSQGGYFILSKDPGKPREIHVVMDAAPLGFLSLAAHGHADALSLTLSIMGKPFLIDPGTYAYHTQKKWRDYFRGTSAHNTLRVDGEDQSLSGGNFMWRHHAQIQDVQWETSDHHDRLRASHDGYKRLPHPVIHRRDVTLDKERDILRITDRLESDGSHLIERFWHFDPHCKVRILGNMMVLVERDGIQIELHSPSKETLIHIHRGEEDPPLGWISNRFDVKEPTTTVVFENRATGREQLATRINIFLPEP